MEEPDCVYGWKNNSCMPAAKNSEKEMLIRDKELAFSQAHSTIALYVGNSSVIWYVWHFWKQATHPIALQNHVK